jgi:hypothetical protein
VGKPVFTTVFQKHRCAWESFAPEAIYRMADYATLQAWWKSATARAALDWRPILPVEGKSENCIGVNKFAKVVLVCWKRTEKLWVFVLDFFIFFGIRGRILSIRNVGPGLREFLVEF